MKKSILALAFLALCSCAALAQTPPANTVWAGPTTGSEGFPSWRSLVNADLGSGVGVCTGTASSLQYNNAGAFGCVTGATSNGTAVTFGNSDIILKGSSTGTTTFTSDNAGASNFTLHFPAANDTLDVLGTSQTFTAALKQFGSGAGTPSHIASGQTTAPAPTSCGGGSPAVAGTDTAGTITLGTTASGCTVTFNVAYTGTPNCVVTWQTNLASMQYTVTNAHIVLVQTSTSSNLVNYICVAPSGG